MTLRPTESVRINHRAKAIVVAATIKCHAPNYATFMSDFIIEGVKIKELRQIMERRYKKPEVDGISWG